jgi:hypothetical protein
MASTPQRVGLTPSGFYFSTRISETVTWAAYPELANDDDYPVSAELIVGVQNTQGQPANGVVVEFQVNPAWMKNTTISQPQAITRSGVARAVLQTTSLDGVRFVVRVDETAQRAEIEVANLSTSPRVYH